MLTARNTAIAGSTQRGSRVPTCPGRMPVRRSLTCRAASNGDEQGPNYEPAAGPVVLKDMQVSLDRFMQKYEHSMLSSGIGAAAVTTYCMLHGQSPGEAAAITVTSTITALVLNEVLFNDNPSA